MGIYKRGRVYWLKFRHRGREIRVSTECKTLQGARQAAARIRDEIVNKDNYGILEHRVAPTVAEFVRESFIPHTDIRTELSHFTKRYYLFGAKQLLASCMAGVPLDQITSEHVTAYIVSRKGWTASGINQALRTLQRVLSLALEWKKIATKPEIKLLRENRRERVLSEQEEALYLSKCQEPWRTMAMIMLDLGLRPDEIRRLRWEDLDFTTMRLRVRKGKTDAAKRTLTMSGRVIASLGPLQQQEGWIWPSNRSTSGHLEQAFLWNQHKAALKESGVDYFEPYSLRHTCLTRMGEYTELPTLKVIAGHTRISMTERYVHPSKDRIEAAFKEAETRRRRSQMKIVGNGKDNGGHKN